MQQPSPSDEQQRYKAAVTKMAKTQAGYTARSLELASTVADAAQKTYKAGYEAGVFAPASKPRTAPASKRAFGWDGRTR